MDDPIPVEPARKHHDTDGDDDPHGDAQHEEKPVTRHAGANLVTAPSPGAVRDWTARRVPSRAEQPRRAAWSPEPRHAVRRLSAWPEARSAAAAAPGPLAAAAGSPQAKKGRTSRAGAGSQSRAASAGLGADFAERPQAALPAAAPRSAPSGGGRRSPTTTRPGRKQ